MFILKNEKPAAKIQGKKDLLKCFESLSEFFITEISKHPEIIRIFYSIDSTLNQQTLQPEFELFQNALLTLVDLLVIEFMFEQLVKDKHNTRISSTFEYLNFAMPLNNPFFPLLDGVITKEVQKKLKTDGEDFLNSSNPIEYDRIEVNMLSIYHEHSLKYTRRIILGTNNQLKLEFNRTLSTKKKMGAFYTPLAVSKKMVELSLKQICQEKITIPLNQLCSDNSKLNSSQIVDRLSSILGFLMEFKILDPSMGTGNFLIEAFEYLREVHGDIIEKLSSLSPEIVQAALQPLNNLYFNGSRFQNCQDWELHILTNILHGVDVDPKAAYVAGLLLFLKFLESQKESNHSSNVLNLNLLVRNALVSPLSLTHEELERFSRRYKEPLYELISIRKKIKNGGKTSEVKSLYEKINLIKKSIRRELIAGNLIQRNGGDRPPTAILLPSDLQTFEPIIWPLDFPELFFTPEGILRQDIDYGFDLVIGNPPWEKWKGQKHEWGQKFANTSLYKEGDTDVVVNELLKSASLRRDYQEYKNYYRRIAEYLKIRYQLTSRGDQNLYKLFMELFLRITKKGGYFSIICPADFLSNKGTDVLRRHILKEASILSILELITGSDFFPEIHDNISVMILTARKGTPTELILSRTKIMKATDLMAYSDNEIREKLLEGITIGQTPSNLSFYHSSLIFQHTPQTNAIPIFDSLESIAVVEKQFQHPRLGDKEWNCKTSSGFHMTKARKDGLIIRQKTIIPVIKGENLVRFGYNNKVKWWVREGMEDKLVFWGQDYIGWKNVSGNDSRRRMRVVLFKANTVAVGNCINVLYNFPPRAGRFLCAIMNSLPFEFRLRQICLGNNINNYIMTEMPVPLYDLSNPLHRRIESWYDEFLPLSKEWANLHGTLKSPIKKSNLELKYIPHSSLLDALSALAYGLDLEDFESILYVQEKLWENYKRLAIKQYQDLMGK